ncbi:MAG: 23S rRNA (adenine(2503)-C(2))-methyltransferase RlmN [Deltaproteobacteria bacterium]|nr:23S rRNA (adenine(2503)-C(2))-methyltransferase RlmN [Deltaproteobacteria bacterium]
MSSPRPNDVPSHPLEWLPEEWQAKLAAWGEQRYRAGQVFRWVHARGVAEPSAMSDLAKGLRERLSAMSPTLAMPVTVPEVRDASDGTRKLLVALTAGGSVESVLIPQTRASVDAMLLQPDDADEEDDADESASGAQRGRGWGPEELPAESGEGQQDRQPPKGAARQTPEPTRVTQCISTQVGCAMGCVFCASGVAGLARNMTAAEIVAQVLVGRALVTEGERLSHVVLMGMGEPLHNYEATARALRLLTHPEGIGLSTRHVTVSTSGLVPEIDRLGREFEGRINLAVSLHATTDEQRSALMPINKRYPLAVLLGALARYPLPKRRRITIEYTLVAGQNDSVADATRLVKLLRPLRVKVNLIPMNPIDASTLEPPDGANVDRFQDVLRDAGYSVFVRRRRGGDIAAACGQLALSAELAKRRVRVPMAPAAR